MITLIGFGNFTGVLLLPAGARRLGVAVDFRAGAFGADLREPALVAVTLAPPATLPAPATLAPPARPVTRACAGDDAPDACSRDGIGDIRTGAVAAGATTTGAVGVGTAGVGAGVGDGVDAVAGPPAPAGASAVVPGCSVPFVLPNSPAMNGLPMHS